MEIRFTHGRLIVDPGNFIEFVVGDEIRRLICEEYNTINLSTIRVADSGLNYRWWDWMSQLVYNEYNKLDHRKKVIHLKLALYDKILHSLFAIDYKF